MEKMWAQEPDDRPATRAAAASLANFPGELQHGKKKASSKAGDELLYAFIPRDRVCKYA
jgi:hypothetical protein